jgi:hypothetical protein
VIAFSKRSLRGMLFQATRYVPRHEEGPSFLALKVLSVGEHRIDLSEYHAVPRGMLSLAASVAGARPHAVPVAVDAAAESDLAQFLRRGADLVIYDAALRAFAHA